MHHASTINLYNSSADNEYVPYIYPQEHGNHTGVRMLRLDKYKDSGVIGGKTGYTKKSGRSLASAAERDGNTLICVTINAPDDWNDHKKLFDFGFSQIYA